jgi:hypothetical protein
MRKVLILLLAMMASVAFSSCSSEDNPVEQEDTLQTVTASQLEKAKKFYSSPRGINELWFENGRITFYEDPYKVYSSYGGVIWHFDYSISGDKIHISRPVSYGSPEKEEFEGYIHWSPKLQQLAITNHPDGTLPDKLCDWYDCSTWK